MRLLKAILMATAIMMMSQAAMADICTLSGTTIMCDNNTSQYTDYRIGKLVSDVVDRIVVCARISGTWTQVGIETYNDLTTTYMIVDGCQYSERIEVVRNTATTMDCDEASSSEVTGIPTDWLIEGYEIYGDEEDDIIFGSDHANERLYGEGEDDEIYGYGGADYLYGGDGNDDLYGGDGVDNIWGEIGVDYIEGNAGGDYLYGGAGTDYIHGNDGEDYIEGNGGADNLWGEADDDIIKGGLKDDDLYGGDGDDDLSGDAGDDDCDGEAGADTCACEDTTSC